LLQLDSDELLFTSIVSFLVFIFLAKWPNFTILPPQYKLIYASSSSSSSSSTSFLWKYRDDSGNFLPVLPTDEDVLKVAWENREPYVEISHYIIAFNYGVGDSHQALQINRRSSFPPRPLRRDEVKTMSPSSSYYPISFPVLEIADEKTMTALNDVRNLDGDILIPGRSRSVPHETCPICYEEFGDETSEFKDSLTASDEAQPSCLSTCRIECQTNNSYHRKCLLTSIKGKSECPMCKIPTSLAIPMTGRSLSGTMTMKMLTSVSLAGHEDFPTICIEWNMDGMFSNVCVCVFLFFPGFFPWFFSPFA
jgi:hypothetical protein